MVDRIKGLISSTPKNGVQPPKPISKVSPDKVQALLIREKSQALLLQIKAELEADYLKVKSHMSNMDVRDSKHSEIFELLASINDNLTIIRQEIAIQADIADDIIRQIRTELKLTSYSLSKLLKKK
jgi:hypothetical protein